MPSFKKLLEKSYSDSIGKSYKTKLAWKVDPMPFVMGNLRLKRKRESGIYDYKKVLKDFLKMINSEK